MSGSDLKRFVFVPLVIAALLGMATGRAAEVREFLDYSLKSGATTLLPGRLYVPPEALANPNVDRPMIVWLHGGGDRGTNNLNQIRWDFDLLFAEVKRRGAFLLAPQAPLNWRPKTITDHVMTMLDRAVGEFNVDAERLYLTGYSSGGGGTWNMLSRYPGRFAAAVAVAPVSAEPDFNPANLVGQSLAVFHARNDSVAPVGTTRSIVNRILTAAGHALPAYPSPTDTHFFFEAPDLDFYYVEPADGDHSVHFTVYNTAPIYDWMFSHGVPEPGGMSIVLSLGAFLTKIRRAAPSCPR
jgi:predicted peptidase